MNAYRQLLDLLIEGETVEAIVFGAYGWGGSPGPGEAWEFGYNEPGEDSPDGPPVPFNKRGVLLTLAEAEPYMQDWSFYSGYGSPRCYATYVWTNKRVIWVTQYDGATSLSTAPRHPVACVPDMPGG